MCLDNLRLYMRKIVMVRGGEWQIRHKERTDGERQNKRDRRTRREDREGEEEEQHHSF